MAVALAPAAAEAAYSDVVLADDPIRYFRMDDSGTTMLNQLPSPDGTHVTSTTGPLFGLEGALAHETPNRGIGYFEGEPDHSTFTFSGFDNVSIELWVFTGQASPGSGVTQWWGGGYGLVDGDIAGSADDLGMAVIRDGHVGFGLGNPDTTLESTTAINDNQWHHVVGTSDGSGNMKLYVDGALEAEQTGAPSSNRTTSNWMVGGLNFPSSGSGQLSGIIDELAIYGRAISQAEVSEHRAAALTAPVPPCKGLACLSAADQQKLRQFFCCSVNALVGLSLSKWKGNGPLVVPVSDPSFAGLFNFSGLFSFGMLANLPKGARAAKQVTIAQAAPVTSPPAPVQLTFTFTKAGLKLLRKAKKKVILTLNGTATGADGATITGTSTLKYKPKKRRKK